MVAEHDPAGCSDLFCQRCDDYGTGYAAGKEKMIGDMLARLTEPPHARDCGCVPCQLHRRFLEHVWHCVEERLR